MYLRNIEKHALRCDLLFKYLAERRMFVTAKMLVLYYSRTGNTAKMANAVAEGAKMITAVDVSLQQVAYNLEPEILSEFDAILVGTPTYHHHMSDNIEKFFENAAVKNITLKGKIGAAFGSYGWSGEAPRVIIEIMKNKFEMNVTDPPLLVSYSPDAAALEKCRELGRKIAERLARPTYQG